MDSVSILGIIGPLLPIIARESEKLEINLQLGSCVKRDERKSSKFSIYFLCMKPCNPRLGRFAGSWMMRMMRMTDNSDM